MKYIVLIMGLLVMGCGKQEQTDTNESTPTTTEKPVKEATLEKKNIVGAYDPQFPGDPYRYVFLANGIREYYLNGKKEEAKHKWSIVNNEIKVKYNADNILIYRLNPDNNMTLIAHISKDGKRTDYPKESQQTFKKIK